LIIDKENHIYILHAPTITLFITTINIAYLVRTEETWICQTSNLHNVCKPFKNKGISLPNTSQEQSYRVTHIPDVWYLLANSNQMQAACSNSTDISLEMLVLRTLKKGLNNNIICTYYQTIKPSTLEVNLLHYLSKIYI